MIVPASHDTRRRRKRRRWFFGGASVVALTLITLLLLRLEPALPVVEKSSIWIATVKRGEMLPQARGHGTLVPEDIRWIPTINAGRVEQILVLPGAAVKSNNVLVELSNPDVEQAAFDAQWQLEEANADLANLRAQLKSQKLIQQATVATAQADYTSAKLDLDVDEDLAKKGLVTAITLKHVKTKADEQARLLEIERDRLANGDEAATAQLAAQEAKIAQLRAQLELKRRQVEALKVCACMDGVLQRLGDPANPLQAGQELAAGALVACVANPASLKAEIKIAETQARDIQLGQPAEIDTQNGVIPGHVVRIDPVVEKAAVTVDVALDAPLPKGARPDLGVDGAIQLGRVEDVLQVRRPVKAQPDSTMRIFKLEPGGQEAVRVPVKLGRGSASTMEIVKGLQAGDQVIVSDMSKWNAHERVKLN